VVVPLDDKQPSATQLRGAFEGCYASLFGRIIPEAPIEIVSWHAHLSRETWRPTAITAAQRAAAPKPLGHREVFDAGVGAFIDYAVYERGQFSPGALVSGPALVVEDETTTVATYAFTVTMDARTNLILERKMDESRAP